MKKWILLSVLLLLGWTVGSVAQSEMSDDEMLQAMDYARFGAFFDAFSGDVPSATFTLEVAAERPDGAKHATVKVSQKLIGEAMFARIDFLTPEELSGDVYIVTPEGIFFWNPDLIGPLKVNGCFEVFGDATVVEVIGIGFSGLYSVKERKEVTLNDGALLCYEFTLEAKEELYERVGFPIVKVVANAETLHPIRLELFDLDGDLLHINTFESYGQNPNGTPYFETQLLDNRIVPVNQTLLTITRIEQESLPDDMFDLDNLGE